MTGARSARIAGNGVARAPDAHSRPQGLESFFIEPSLGKAPELPRTGAACRYWSRSYHGGGRASPGHPNLSGSRAVRFRSRVRSAGEAELATVRPAEKTHLRQRAELVRSLFALS